MATMVKERSKSDEIYEWYWNIRNDTQDWRRRRDECIQKYHGNQWPTDVKAAIENKDQIAVVINTLRPFIKLRAAMMTAHNPQGVVLGYHTKDTTMAGVYSDLLSYIQYISKFNKVTQKVVLSQQREGVGYYIIHIDPDADYGRGEIKIAYVPYREIFVDKNTSEWDYSDAPRIIHSKLLDPVVFLERYSDFINRYDDLEPFLMSDDEIRWSGKAMDPDNTDAKNIDILQSSYKMDFIRIYDNYERRTVEMRALRYFTGKVVPVEDNYNLTDDENAFLKDGTITEVTYKVPRIMQYTAIGNATNTKMLDEVQLPLRYYPIVPVVDEDTGNALHLGEIDYVEGLQELRNKVASLLLYNTAVGSNLRYFGDAGALSNKDLDEIKHNLGKPNGIALVDRGPNGEWPLQELRPEPINQAFMTLDQQYTHDIQMGLGTYALRAGDPQQTPNTATMGLSLAEWSQDVLRPSINNLDVAIERVFDLVLELIPHVYNQYKVFEVGVGDDAREQFINKPMRNENLEIVKLENDITSIHARYRIRAGSTLPTNSIAKLNLFKELAVVNPVFMEYMIDNLPDLRNEEKQELKQKLDIVPQLQQQVGAFEQALKELQGRYDGLEKKYETSELDNERLRIRFQEYKKQQRQADAVDKSDKSEKGSK